MQVKLIQRGTPWAGAHQSTATVTLAFQPETHPVKILLVLHTVLAQVRAVPFACVGVFVHVCVHVCVHACVCL
jgi:hypothetical protein